MGELIKFPGVGVSRPIRMWCVSCGREVTTPAAAAIVPCSCGATARSSVPLGGTSQNGWFGTVQVSTGGYGGPAAS
jgi:hypothetical protein